MNITYKTKKVEKICTSVKAAEKIYGIRMTEKLHQRLDELSAADTVEMMIQFHIGRCHPLTQNRKGQYALDLIHPYRLVFEKDGEKIQIARIVEIVDYH
ncbi:MAG: type II toxin-antitoxin system RelE/ParE family toxin [Clostridiales bacterium]|nr:type II toxin-antitoxin system RelE/ParE family toxin [Clostridiales bacterium]